MDGDTKIHVCIGIRNRIEKYRLERLFNGLIPPYKNLSVKGSDIRFRFDLVDGGDIELDKPQALQPRATLAYRGGCLSVGVAALVVEQMESEGWIATERPKNDSGFPKY